jgi:hypothetical protein
MIAITDFILKFPLVNILRQKCLRIHI